ARGEIAAEGPAAGRRVDLRQPPRRRSGACRRTAVEDAVVLDAAGRGRPPLPADSGRARGGGDRIGGERADCGSIDLQNDLQLRDDQRPVGGIAAALIEGAGGRPRTRRPLSGSKKTAKRRPFRAPPENSPRFLPVSATFGHQPWHSRCSAYGP